MKQADVCIAGAGILGLTLALALHDRGLTVTVVTAGRAMDEASSAAAGMLAVEDPENPLRLLELSRYSRALYPAYLEGLAEGGAAKVTFQTERTLQVLDSDAAVDDGAAALAGEALRQTMPELRGDGTAWRELAEASLDPRELAAALLTAVERAAGPLLTGVAVLTVDETAQGLEVRTAQETIACGLFVDCTGAWSLSSAQMPELRIRPRKGQMLTVPTPRSLAAGLVLRAHSIYMVPRLHGPRAGQTVLGATVEDAGFDRALDQRQLAELLERAVTLLPELENAPMLERWSGLRPATDDLLPVIGALPGSTRRFIASGHYRNGILLAPGTAACLARVMLGEPPPVSLAAFAPGRFAAVQRT